jgi:hypothetical protein
MKVLKFNQYSILESTPNLIENKILTLQFTDESGQYEVLSKMIDRGWGLDRSVIYYRFSIIKSNSDKYPTTGEFILPIDFNDKEFTFLMYPYYNELHSKRAMTELHYKAYCKIIQ